MLRYGLDADRAFAVLRRTSQQTNVKISAIAEQLIATGEFAGLTMSRDDQHAQEW
jgi:AmiR/NasT family two-component response regulator